MLSSVMEENPRLYAALFLGSLIACKSDMQRNCSDVPLRTATFGCKYHVHINSIEISKVSKRSKDKKSNVCNRISKSSQVKRSLQLAPSALSTP